MRSTLTALLAGLLLLTSCGKRPAADAFAARFVEIQNTLREGTSLEKDGQHDAARETLERAWGKAVDLLSGSPASPPRGQPGRVDVMELLARISFGLSEYVPGRLVFAVRFANRAMKEQGGTWPAPRLTLGRAYVKAGLFGRAVDVFTAALALVPERIRSETTHDLIVALYDQASVLARRGGPDAALMTRKLLQRAWKLDKDMATNTKVFRALAALQARYQAAAEAAQKKGHLLDLAKIHAQFGLSDKALDYLNQARSRDGMTAKSRWVAARYVGEMSGDPALLAQAVRLYREMQGRGERPTQARAGLARVYRRLGRGNDALAEFGHDPDMSAALRAALIRIRLDRLQQGRFASKKQKQNEIAALKDLFLGGLDPAIRGDLLVDAGFTAASLGDTKWLTDIIHDFQTRYPRDLRVMVLEASLEDLMKAPLPGTKNKGDG